MIASGGYANGTNEELLALSWEGSNQRQRAAADATYQREGDRWDWVSGVERTTLQDRVLSEVSGDEYMRMQQLTTFDSDPAGEADMVQLALMRARQEGTQGTNFISSFSMSDTPEAQMLGQRRDELIAMVRNQPGLEHVEPLVGDDGMLTPEAYAALARNDRNRVADERHRAYVDAHPDPNAPPPPIERVSDQELRNRATKGLPEDLSILSHRLGIACDDYRAEIDRQEAIVLSAIQIGGMILSIALMLIPGIGPVLGAVLGALITGVATMVAKQGFRGERYGWEEMLQDAGQTAIEVAVAWAGGKLAAGAGRVAGQVEQAATAAARVTAVSERAAIEAGKRAALRYSVRQAIIRGAATQGFSHAAGKAIDDATWRDGMWAGVRRVATAGAHGAVVGAVSDAISTGLGHGLQQRATGENVVRGAEAAEGAVERAAGAAGRPSILRTAFAEGASNALANTAGTLAGAGFDAITGESHLTGGQLLRELGTTAGREFLLGFARGGLQARNTARYEQAERSYLDRGTPLNAAERAELHALARSAGHEFGTDEHIRGLEQRLAVEPARRALVAELPASLRDHVREWPFAEVQRVHGYVNDPPEGAARFAVLKAIQQAGVGELDLGPLARRLDDAAAEVGQRRAREASEQRQVRGALLGEVPPHLRQFVGVIPSANLATLPPEALRTIGEAMASGRPLSARERVEIVRQARAANPEADVRGLLRDLQAVASAGEAARDAFKSARRQLIESLPEQARPMVAALDDASLARVRHMIDRGALDTPHQMEALYRAARARAPDLERSAFFGALEHATEGVRAQRNAERRARRQERFERLQDLPDPVRGPISALPDHALLELRTIQAREAPPTPREMEALLAAARRETPGVDERRLRGAILEASRSPSPTRPVSDAQRAEMREFFLSNVPDELHALANKVDIVVLSEEEFHAYTRSDRDAALLVIDGRPVVAMREHAHPRALSEEGLHFTQTREPEWAAHVRAVDERNLGRWPEMGDAERAVAVRKALDLELDAAHRLVANAEDTLRSKPGDREARIQLEDAQAAIANLEQRRAAVASFDEAALRGVERGTRSRPEWLDQPARLFAQTRRPPVGFDPKNVAARLGANKTLHPLLASLPVEPDGSLPPRTVRLELVERNGQPTVILRVSESAHVLKITGAHVTMAAVLQTHADAVLRVRAVRSQLDAIRAALPEGARARADSALARLAIVESRLTQAATEISTRALGADEFRRATDLAAGALRRVNADLELLRAVPHLVGVAEHVEAVIAGAPAHLRQELEGYRAYLTALATTSPEQATRFAEALSRLSVGGEVFTGLPMTISTSTPRASRDSRTSSRT